MIEDGGAGWRRTRRVRKKRGPIDRGWKEEEEEHKPREEGKREPIDRGRRSTSRVRKEGA